MAMVRYTPWGGPGVGELQSEINRLFSNFVDPESSSAATAAWVPAVDIQEFKDRFEIYIDLPGVDPSGVEITLEDGVLSISGERSALKPVDGEEVVRRRTERGQGGFHRRFTLPDTVDAERVEARERHGVLEVTIPKQEKAQPRRITVTS